MNDIHDQRVAPGFLPTHAAAQKIEEREGQAEKVTDREGEQEHPPAGVARRPPEAEPAVQGGVAVAQEEPAHQGDA
jgi:hypothetical protein